MADLRVCIDVPNLEAAIAFYTRALGLELARRSGAEWAELQGASAFVDLLAAAPGTPASPACAQPRDYARHWTPVHVDLVVPDLEPALRRALEAGAVLERPVVERSWGRMANLADPFGHGLCLVEFRGRGYGEIADP
jgi:catechol 2,3-dioxygenase-like lactoylglutathione lyase family enzyme